jgi:hypothetical protein
MQGHFVSHVEFILHTVVFCMLYDYVWNVPYVGKTSNQENRPAYL